MNIPGDFASPFLESSLQRTHTHLWSFVHTNGKTGTILNFYQFQKRND